MKTHTDIDNCYTFSKDSLCAVSGSGFHTIYRGLTIDTQKDAIITPACILCKYLLLKCTQMIIENSPFTHMNELCVMTSNVEKH